MNVIEGRFFLDGRLEKCCVGIEEGKISAIKKLLKGEEHHDFGDNLIIPGCIDPHVHFREPGGTEKEDFFTGTMAAAFAGVTCVLDMPNNNPPVNDLGSLKEKLGLVKQKANVDFGLYSALVKQGAVDDLCKLTTGFKVYMAETTGSSGLTVGRDELKSLLPRVMGKRTVSVHCEDEKLFKKFEEKDLEDHLNARPSKCEVSAIEDVVGVASMSKGKIHIAHISSSEGANMVGKARQTHGITSEVTPHHMLLNVDSDLKAFGKVNPPLRRKRDNETLRETFFSGNIDLLASDHAPHTVSEKERDFASAPPGMPGVETGVPIALTFVKRNLISLERFVDATSREAAEIFSLNKGIFKVGYDGDLAVFDIKNVAKVESENLHSKCGWTPYDGCEAIFPRAVFLGGELIVEEGNLVSERNGKFIGYPK
jgi:dihydroorotase